MLLLVSGLPGTGKSAVAVRLAQDMRSVHLSVDEVEDAMLGAGLPRDWTTGVAAYEAVRAAAEQNLALGHSVVVDAVNDSAAARSTWHSAAERSHVVLRFVHLIPPPTQEHQRRLTTRRRSLVHVPEPTWEQVQARAAIYEPWVGECFSVDSAQPLEAVVREIHRRLISTA